jgi:hypothetical protein
MKRLLTAFLLLAGVPALAGPPFVTDDPEPVDYQHWEINTAMQGTYTNEGRAGAWPTADINYGPLPDVQAHVGLFATYDKVSGDTFHYGYGDTEIGVKWRFIDEDDDGWRPQVAIYPITQFPTGLARRGLGAGHQRTILPVWLQKSFGDWTVYGGAGYWINHNADTDRNYWFTGMTVLRKLNEDWTLGAEIFHQTADLTGRTVEGGTGVSSRPSTGFNFGGYYTLDEANNLIFTFGRGLQNIQEANRFSYYVGDQLHF